MNSEKLICICQKFLEQNVLPIVTTGGEKSIGNFAKKDRRMRIVIGVITQIGKSLFTSDHNVCSFKR
jgi:hypothetical protein